MDHPTPTGVVPVLPTGLARPPITYLLDRAHTAHNAGDYRQSADLYTRVLEQDPESRDALYNRGQARHKLGDYPGAADDFRKVLHYAPGLAWAWHRYAAAHHMMGDTLIALACIEKALDLDPTNAENHHLYAGVLHYLNRDEEAEKEWGIAHQMDPNRVQTATSAAMTLLRKDAGRNLEGWRLFETRRSIGVTDLYPDMPLWTNRPGQDIQGQTILVRCEQGHGDTMQFLRYLTPLLALGAEVHLESSHAMKRLIASSYPEVHQFHRDNKAHIPLCDWQTSLMSLPLAFPAYDNGGAPYLFLQAVDQSFFDVPPRRYPSRLGYVWHGGARPEDPEANAVDRRRSIPTGQAEQLRGQLAMRAKVVSLQQEDMPDTVWDFYETARIVLGLDLVITVDTAVAHLAGALGVPVWVLNRFDSCWRWGVSGDTSHWYASMRLFRQPTSGDWDTVIKRVLVALDKEQGA